MLAFEVPLGGNKERIGNNTHRTKLGGGGGGWTASNESPTTASRASVSNPGRNLLFVGSKGKRGRTHFTKTTKKKRRTMTVWQIDGVIVAEGVSSSLSNWVNASGGEMQKANARGPRASSTRTTKRKLCDRRRFGMIGRQGE